MHTWVGLKVKFTCAKTMSASRVENVDDMALVQSYSWDVCGICMWIVDEAVMGLSLGILHADGDGEGDNPY